MPPQNQKPIYPSSGPEALNHLSEQAPTETKTAEQPIINPEIQPSVIKAEQAEIIVSTPEAQVPNTPVEATVEASSEEIVNDIDKAEIQIDKKIAPTLPEKADAVFKMEHTVDYADLSEGLSSMRMESLEKAGLDVDQIKPK